jgi:serine/threonine protein kinase/tetratricopeptide (TPR) repeat protein
LPDLKGESIGRYRVLDKLGVGGMGEVWRAHDTVLGRDVAIKVLPEEFARDSERRERFEREAKAVAALSHPNILEIHDFGTEGTTGYAVTELLEGETLRGVIQTGGLTESKACEYASQISRGLSAAHERGIFHRDLKPDNVFVTTDGFVKILDFGLAKLAEAALAPGEGLESLTQDLPTKPGSVLGTIGYMSPEQLKGQPADHRSDIFSFGCVLYEMLAGRRAFGGNTGHEIGAAILQQDPPPLTGCATGIERIVIRCLEKRRDDRFQSARDLTFALEAIGARPAEIPTSDSKRGPRITHVIAVVFAVIIAALVVLPPEGLWQRFSGQADVAQIRAIAILPLENISGDPEQEYFSDGMTEALITRLAQISSLDVISRTSVMLYKNSGKNLPQIARELGVDGVVEGSVTRGENDVRITVQLIHGATDHHLWAQDYHRPLRDILLLQSEVARAVAEEINVVLTPDEEQRLVEVGQVDPEAHEAYLKGMHSSLQFTGEGISRGIEFLEHARKLDPGFADAYSGLAAAHLNSTYFLGLPPTEVVPRARSAMSKALEIDPNNAPAVLTSGWIEMTYDWNWQAATTSHLRALELGPSLSYVHINYSYLLASLGHFEEAYAHARRAEVLDPLSPIAGEQVGMVLYLARRYDEAIVQLDKVKAINPYAWFTYLRLAQVLLLTEDYQRGIEIMRRGIELAGPTTVRSGKHVLAPLLARAGRRQEAIAILEELTEQSRTTYVPPTDFAKIHLALENHDEAFEWLEKAFELRDADLFMTNVSPEWDPLRGDPRFDDLLHRLNLAND